MKDKPLIKWCLVAIIVALSYIGMTVLVDSGVSTDVLVAVGVAIGAAVVMLLVYLEKT